MCNLWHNLNWIKNVFVLSPLTISFPRYGPLGNTGQSGDSFLKLFMEPFELKLFILASFSKITLEI